jgi:hypothetical protein
MKFRNLTDGMYQTSTGEYIPVGGGNEGQSQQIPNSFPIPVNHQGQSQQNPIVPVPYPYFQLPNRQSLVPGSLPEIPQRMIGTASNLSLAGLGNYQQLLQNIQDTTTSAPLTVTPCTGPVPCQKTLIWKPQFENCATHFIPTPKYETSPRDPRAFVADLNPGYEQRARLIGAQANPYLPRFHNNRQMFSQMIVRDAWKSPSEIAFRLDKYSKRLNNISDAAGIQQAQYGRPKFDCFSGGHT